MSHDDRLPELRGHADLLRSTRDARLFAYLIEDLDWAAAEISHLRDEVARLAALAFDLGAYK